MSSGNIILDDVLYIYTDGSSIQSPRRGGFGIRLLYVDQDGEEYIQDIQSPGYLGATNNRMELMACVVALKEAMRLHLADSSIRVIIRTDSLYIFDNINKAKYEWPKNKWFRKGGAPVLNADLWKDLIREMKKIGKKVDFEWIKGHAQNEHNKAVDKMARESARMATESPHALVHVRRKLTTETVRIGSVEMKGQRLSIRIITTEYLNVQKLWKCKYEVITKTSDYYTNVDLIYSDTLLGAGHSYYVQVNTNQDNPRVIKVFKELNLD